jgi:hypothetical protein
VATTLNNMAILYHDTQRQAEAEGAFMAIRRDLAGRNPEAYRPL